MNTKLITKQHFMIPFYQIINLDTAEVIRDYFLQQKTELRYVDVEKVRFFIKIYVSEEKKNSLVIIDVGLQINVRLMVSLTIKLKEMLGYTGYLGCMPLEDVNIEEYKITKDASYKLLFNSQNFE